MTADARARCEPPPELLRVDGWHWVEYQSPRSSDVRKSCQHWDHNRHWSQRAMDEPGYRYIAPVTPPAEVEALRAEVMRASTECADAMAQVVALRARVARLEWALEDLIDVQVLSTGWDNGVTDSTGTMNEGEYLHARAFDKALAALSAETP